jgi:hypothetical protein
MRRLWFDELVDMAAKEFLKAKEDPALTSEVRQVVASLTSLLYGRECIPPEQPYSDDAMELVAAMRSSTVGVIASYFGNYMFGMLDGGFDPWSVMPLDERRAEQVTGNKPAHFGPYGESLFQFIRQIGGFADHAAALFLASDPSETAVVRNLLSLQSALTQVYRAGYGNEPRWPEYPEVEEHNDHDALTFNWIDGSRTAGLCVAGVLARHRQPTMIASQRLIAANVGVFHLLAAHANRFIVVYSRRGLHMLEGDGWLPPTYLTRRSLEPTATPKLFLGKNTPFDNMRQHGKIGLCSGFHRMPGQVHTPIDMVVKIAPLVIPPLIHRIREIYVPARMPDTSLPVDMDFAHDTSIDLLQYIADQVLGEAVEVGKIPTVDDLNVWPPGYERMLARERQNRADIVAYFPPFREAVMTALGLSDQQFDDVLAKPATGCVRLATAVISAELAGCRTARTMSSHISEYMVHDATHEQQATSLLNATCNDRTENVFRSELSGSRRPTGRQVVRCDSRIVLQQTQPDGRRVRQPA